MKSSEKIKQFIKNMEKLSLVPYLDPVGIWTVGWGHALAAKPVYKSITLIQANLYFEQDISKAEEAFRRCVKVPVTQGLFDASISLIFNMGEKAFAQSSICKYINERNPLEAVSYFSRYCHGGNVVLKGLLKRRAEEILIFLNEDEEINMFDALKTIGDATKVIGYLQEIEKLDADKDGVSDVQEFKNLGQKLLADLVVIKGDIAAIMALEGKVVEYLSAQNKPAS